ncbi:glycosyltransferase family 4 protein [Rhodococcus opacus]|uniref:glycosyltransferase family 4 protein n=1 Tax=Rhodococcus opacus TaxID=37919 RepID=UPI0029494777|nr:glycosyltransferase family 4 protein [Rhodococcus opacus]MDV6241224.1 glycosyltransferase family 4 protein [Rhodococcus opacus]
MHVCLMGPVAPSALKEHLRESDRIRSDLYGSNYGAPVAELANSLILLGHRVSVVTYRRGYDEVHLRGPSLEFYQVDGRRSRRDQALDQWKHERAAMTDIANELDVDVVHAHWTYEWALAALDCPHPVVVTIHDAPLTILRHHLDAYRLIRLSMAWRVRARHGDRLFSAVSPYVEGRWRRELIDRGPIRVVPNVVTAHFRSQDKFEQPTVIEIADAGRRKNVLGLLGAFRTVRANIMDAQLLLVGPGLHSSEKLASTARSADLADGVSFLGELPRAQTQLLLAKSWVHAHFSLEESFGMTLVEAIGCGTSVIAGAESGAAGWVLNGGRAGWLSNLSDVAESAGRLIDALSCISMRSSMELAGRAHYESALHPRVVAGEYVDLYTASIFP